MRYLRYGSIWPQVELISEFLTYDDSSPNRSVLGISDARVKGLFTQSINVTINLKKRYVDRQRGMPFRKIKGEPHQRYVVTLGANRPLVMFPVNVQ